MKRRVKEVCEIGEKGRNHITKFTFHANTPTNTHTSYTDDTTKVYTHRINSSNKQRDCVVHNAGWAHPTAAEHVIDEVLLCGLIFCPFPHYNIHTIHNKLQSQSRTNSTINTQYNYSCQYNEQQYMQLTSEVARHTSCIP